LKKTSKLGTFPSYVTGAWKQTLATLYPGIPFKPGKTGALVLIPGAMCTSSVMNRLGLKLQRHGLKVCVPPSFPYFLSALANTCRLGKAAAAYLDWLDGLSKLYGIREVDVVGHSNGGLIALLAQDLIDSQERTCRVRMNRLITLASPLRGFPGARALSPVLPCCRDIAPGSSTLRRTARARRLLAGCLVAGGDFLIPPGNQFLDPGRRILMENFQHMDFIVGSDEKVNRSANEIARILA